MKSILRLWIPLVGVLTLMVGLLYASVQQVHRSGADDPQIQMAEDAAKRLNARESIQDIVPVGEVEISESLAPFLNFYDADGQAVAGNGLLHGSLPDYPWAHCKRRGPTARTG
ncbi:MAG: hypothetical protein DWG76_04050 [Chloroflexi bacterium]|nr:hypothetical protein [Chloroflexota bacterium]